MPIRAGLFALLLPSLAAAQGATISASDPDSVLEAIRAFGHKAKLQTDENGFPLIAVDREGLKYWVYFYGCDNPEGCLDIQFYSNFDVEQPLTPQWANDWNIQWVAGRADVNPEGDPALSYFVTTTGGLSQDNFMGVMQVWDMTLNGFLQDIGW